MRLKRAFLVCCLAFGAASACFAQGTFRLVFTNAEITAVLRAISMRTGASIVYAGKEDVKVSISVTASSTSDALRAVSSAAGMIFRRVGSTFVVAPSEGMRSALEPFGERMKIVLESTLPQEAALAISESFPHITTFPRALGQIGSKTTTAQTQGTGAQTASVNTSSSAGTQAGASAQAGSGNGTQKETVEIDSRGAGAEGEDIVRKVNLNLLARDSISSYSQPMHIMLVGTSDDLMAARQLLKELEAANKERSVFKTSFPLQRVSPSYAAQLVMKVLPGVEAHTLGRGASSGNAQVSGGGIGGSLGSGAQSGLGNASPGSAQASKEALAVEKGGGVIVLRGSQSLVEEAIEFLSTMDKAVDVSVYAVRYADARTLKNLVEASTPVSVDIGPESYLPAQASFNTISGATIGGRTGAQGSFSGGGGATVQGRTPDDVPRGEARARHLILYGTTGQLETAHRLLEQVDIKPQQVLVEVKVIDASPEVLENLGMKWNWTPFNFLETPSGTPLPGFAGQTRKPGFGTFSRVPWNAIGILEALSVTKDVKILANPSVSVIDGDDANIFIGETIRTKIATTTGLGTQSSEVVEFPVGIALLIRPRVNANGDITMRLHPGISTVTGLSSDGLPQTSTREAETTVLVRNGETVVIGGLIREEMSKTISEIPILSKLPLIGELFRHRSSSSKKSEVMVFITTYLVNELGERVDHNGQVLDKKAGGR